MSIDLLLDAHFAIVLIIAVVDNPARTNVFATGIDIYCLLLKFPMNTYDR